MLKGEMWNDLWAIISYINYNSFHILFCIGTLGGFRLIISIKELIEMCVTLTDGTIPVKELMEDYHLRFNENGLSSPVNDVSLDKTNKAIEMKFNQAKTWDGIGDVE